MAWQLGTFALVHFALAAVTATLGIWAIRYRRAAGARSLGLLMGAIALWTACAGALLALPDSLFRWAVGNLMYLGIALIPVFFLFFAEAYTNHETPLTAYGPAPLLAVPILTQILVWTNPAHGLMWGPNVVNPATPEVGLSRAFGPYFWVHSAYSYGLLAVGAGLLVRMLIVSDHLYRGQMIAILVALTAPVAANAVFLFDLVAVAIDPTPPAFAVTALAFFVALYRQRLLDLVPMAREVARDELMDNLVEAVFILDDDGRIVDCNEFAASIAGADGTDLVGRTLKDVLADSTPADADLADAVAADDEVDELAVREDGTVRYFDVEVTELRRGGGLLTGHLVSLQDVTDRRRREQRLNVLNRALRHDLRNEANVVLGYAELGRRDHPDAEWVDEIERHVSGMIEMGRKVRQIEQALGDEAVVPQPVDVVPLVEETVAEYEAGRAGITVETDMPATARASAVEFVDLAIENVIENAIEHNDKPVSMIDVRVAVRVTADAVVLEVADNGPGIHEDELDVLLAGRETQLDHVSGLGLWIVNWIVTESGGTVSFDENDPRGSVVTISLPRAERPAEGGKPTEADGAVTDDGSPAATDDESDRRDRITGPVEGDSTARTDAVAGVDDGEDAGSRF